jgi:hypothetical protein
MEAATSATSIWAGSVSEGSPKELQDPKQFGRLPYDSSGEAVSALLACHSSPKASHDTGTILSVTAMRLR